MILFNYVVSVVYKPKWKNCLLKTEAEYRNVFFFKLLKLLRSVNEWEKIVTVEQAIYIPKDNFLQKEFHF